MTGNGRCSFIKNRQAPRYHPSGFILLGYYKLSDANTFDYYVEAAKAANEVLNIGAFFLHDAYNLDGTPMNGYVAMVKRKDAPEVADTGLFYSKFQRLIR